MKDAPPSPIRRLGTCQSGRSHPVHALEAGWSSALTKPPHQQFGRIALNSGSLIMEKSLVTKHFVDERTNASSSITASKQGTYNVLELPKSIDLSHHLSDLAKNRAPSPLKAFMKYYGRPGLLTLAGGEHL